MSLSSFKESLKPCSNNLSSTSAISSSFLADSWSISSSSSSSSSSSPRKPPKSSLSQQLLRLQDPLDWPQTQLECSQKEVPLSSEGEGEEEEVEEEDEDEWKHRFPVPKLESFQFDTTGPYEPLVLSPPDEIPVIQVPASINCRLLEHQREGVKFLYNLYSNNHGGILGDDMGLGKTIQTIAFLAAIYGKDGESNDLTSRRDENNDMGPVLIICPSSVIHNWESEFSKWATFSVSVYHGPNRDLILDKIEARQVEIMITSFDTFRIQGSILTKVDWEIMVVDEAHRLKNEKSKLYTACLDIKTKRRYGLTGTIMQNKIMELFNLFDWVVPGCLGTRDHFHQFYDEPLKQGQRSSAPERYVQVADERKQHLVRLLHKYLLRRTKEETIGHLMMGKEDNVVFCAMSDLQKRVYQRMLQLPEIQCLINKDLLCGCGSPLKQVECCKRIVPDGIIWKYLHKDNPDGCDSCPFCLVLPCLVKLQQVFFFFFAETFQLVFEMLMSTNLHSSLKISNHLELIKPNSKDDPEKQRRDAEFTSAVFGTDIELVGGNTQNESFMGLSDVKHCGKMRTLENLMSSWTTHGDKILLFSYSVRMLDILEKFLIRKGYCFSRLDGSTPTGSRQSLVENFNSSPSKQVFLISTRAGGLGLNLVSANRVVIFDPNWNPAHDLQAQDRSFRFGQKRHVIVFRFLAAGSLEELVYTRQVYKQQLANIAVSGRMEKRYFEGVQDCKEFQGELFGISNLFRDLSDKLFTSEIIEKQEKERGNVQCAKQKLLEPDTYLSPGTTTSEPERNEMMMAKPLLEDMGIVYAHRYEDIVNIGHETRGEKELSNRSEVEEDEDCCYQSSRSRQSSERTSCSSDVVGGGANEMTIACAEKKKKKRQQYSLLAQSLGMGEVEFSRWLVSVTPGDREKVLLRFKKGKLNKPNGLDS